MNDKLFTMTGIPVSQIVERLAEPFEPRAYTGVPGGADLTDINTGYMIERATQVFGLRGLGWKLEYSPENMQFIGLGEGKRMTAHLKYAVFSYALINEQDEVCWYAIITGGASTNDYAYAEEGARTSAIGAALKSLCFQLPVYKGKLDHHNAVQLLGEAAAPDGNTGDMFPSGNGKGDNGNGASERRSTEQVIKELGYADQAQPGTTSNAHPDEDEGAHVIQYGKTYSGWTLRRIVEANPRGSDAGLAALRWYANEMKPVTEIAHKDQSAAKKFLAFIESQLQIA
jgi:hypothetical protein